MHRKIKAVLFDLDGVLIDSKPVMKIAWESVMSKYKIKNQFSEYEKYIGIPFNIILDNLLIDKSLHDSIKDHYFNISSKNKNKILLNYEVNHILNILNKSGLKIGIVTSKDELRTKELIAFFQLEMQIIVTPEQTLRGKPYSDPIIYAAENLKIPTNQILFVGDMFSDMQCAKNARCHYLHFLRGYEKLNYQIYGGEINSLLQIEEYLKWA